jgi:hypothetical protein
MMMTAREIADECIRRGIRIFCVSDTEVLLATMAEVLPDGTRKTEPVPGWLEDAARESAQELVDHVRYRQAAARFAADSERRLRAICPSKRLRKSPLWQRYEEKMGEAGSANDLERLKAALDEREKHVVLLFGDQREERKKKYRERRYAD